MEIESKKAVLTDENREESARLKKLWIERKRIHGLTQTEFGDRFGIGTQAAVWMCLNGKMAISLKAATGFAQGLLCSVADFSPRLDAMLNAASSAALNAALGSNPISDNPKIEQTDRPPLYAVEAKSEWPFELFDYDGWMMLPPKDREAFENLIAGAIFRTQKMRSIKSPATHFT